MATYLIIIATDTDLLEVMAKHRTFDEAKELARRLWAAMREPLLLKIKQLMDGGKFEVVFTYEEKKK